MKLVSVYDVGNSEDILYSLLKERDENVNISHKKMPEFSEHQAFVSSHPYVEWYLIVNDDEYVVGSCYITDMHEIGVQIFKAARRKGYGRFAVNSLIIRHPDKRLLANINPNNDASIRLFSGFGFKFIQVTFERDPSDH